ncbi:UNVERIFIED_CONTAM: hypothetical protein FKN15_017879 [Acipenser sinensis]
MTNPSHSRIEIAVVSVEEVSVVLLNPFWLSGGGVIESSHQGSALLAGLKAAFQSHQGPRGIPGEHAPHQGRAKSDSHQGSGFLASRTGSQSFWVEPSGGEEDTDLKFEYSGDNLEDLFSIDERPEFENSKIIPNQTPRPTTEAFS